MVVSCNHSFIVKNSFHYSGFLIVGGGGCFFGFLVWFCLDFYFFGFLFCCCYFVSPFQMNLRIVLSMSLKNCFGNLMGIA
jgi:hypothetical protein